MLITLENESKRLQRELPEPFCVTAYRSTTSRSPIIARFATKQAAFAFVETITGLAAIRWVQEPSFDYSVETFTGKHVERFGWCQYRTPSIDAVLTL